jgi:hypothetical protein
MDHPKPASPLVTEHHCANLRHKGMYVMSVEDPDESVFYDPFEATAYWCACTQSGMGPDRKAVTRHACSRDAHRGCCE